MAKRLGIVPFRYAAPLFRELRRDTGGRFELAEDVPARLAVRLREKTLDAAFLSPIDYGRDYAMYSVLPGLCAASTAASSRTIVVFRQGIRSVKTLAVQPISSTEIVLATIIFAEQFGITPTIIPYAGTLMEGLGKADAVLCIGDEAPDVPRSESTLNLIEEWDELTALPFVHGFWVARPNALTREEIDAIQGLAAGTADEADAQDASIRFSFGEHEREAVREFFRMAYYHGILSDLPDLNIYREDDPRLEKKQE